MARHFHIPLQSGDDEVPVSYTHLIPKTRKIKVKIPPGVDSGIRMRVEGEGEAGVRGGPPGDVYVYITVKPHPVFTRRGNDLLCEEPISIYQATLGDEIEVASIDGKSFLRIPEGTQTGTSFRLRGKGMPDVRGRGRDVYKRQGYDRAPT